MSDRDDYPAGVPCWVEGLHRDTEAARAFYGPLLGWEFEGSGGDSASEYFVARLRGREVAGLAPMPAMVEDTDGGWMTHVAVDSAADAAEMATRAGGQVMAGPMELPPAGNLSVIADPAGAIFCAWERDARFGAEVVNEAGAWSMSALRTDDAERADAFYKEMFGWDAEPFGPDEAGMALYRLPGFVGGEPSQPVPRDVVAVRMPLGQDEQPHWHIDFWIDDAEAAAAKVRDLGGAVVSGPEEWPPFIQAELADPQGGVFSVSQLVVD